MFSRSFDDQLAMTVPAAIAAPNRSWYMEAHGIDLKVFHNYQMDGRGKKLKTFKKWFAHHGPANFSAGYKKCNITCGG